MGNCIATRKSNILSEDDDNNNNKKNRREPNKQLEKTGAVGRSTSTTFRAADSDDNKDMKKKVKRSVRFRVGEEERKGKSGVVRIKLVLTQKELDRILNSGDEDQDQDQEKDSSAERLLMKAINMRRRRSRISEEYGNRYHQWKPSLESIPEEII